MINRFHIIIVTLSFSSILSIKSKPPNDPSMAKMYNTFLEDEKKYNATHKVKELTRLVGLKWSKVKSDLLVNKEDLVLTTPRGFERVYRCLCFDEKCIIIKIYIKSKKIYKQQNGGGLVEIKPAVSFKDSVNRLNAIFLNPYPLGGEQSRNYNFSPIIIEQIDHKNNYKWAIRSNHTTYSSRFTAIGAFMIDGKYFKLPMKDR